ncbi:hypothetical protein V5O48_000351 [Marasmius crinis-equi]|uniref:NAD(P)-binding protein n=1 Tax=Marasmius crinis-equi TaxID=585013 RepID=A0ABR3G231_9AGAR
MAPSSLVVLVTGSNAGVGFELVRLLAQQGYTVYLSGRNDEYVRKAVKTLKEDHGLDVKSVLLDVTRDDSVSRAKETIERAEGRLDVLVNNAGLSPSEFTVEGLSEIFDANYFGVIRVTTAFLPLIRKAKRGNILNVSSGSGSHYNQSRFPERYPPQRAAYYGSKAALNAYTISLAKELKNNGIRVNSITPGWMSTKMSHFTGDRSAAEGAEVLLPWVTLNDDDGRTGVFAGYSNEEGKLVEEIPW